MRSVLVLITVNDKGDISVDVRGPVKDKEGMLAILEAARELVEQGTYRAKLYTTDLGSVLPPYRQGSFGTC